MRSNQKGFTLLETMISLGITGLVMSAFVSVMNIGVKMQTDLRRTDVRRQIKQQLVSTLYKPQAWVNTLADTRNDNLACLRHFAGIAEPGDPTTCREGNRGSFRLRTGNSNRLFGTSGDRHYGEVVYDGRTTTANETTGAIIKWGDQGFDYNGQTCTFVTGVTKASDCPYSFALTWTAICDRHFGGQECASPQILIEGKFGTRVREDVSNFEKYNFEVYLNPPQVSTSSIARLNHSDGSGWCAIYGNGEVKCWGSNGGGLAGTGLITPEYHTSPVTASALSGLKVEQIGSGSSHACAVLGEEDGRAVMCWGNDGTHGILGLGPAHVDGPLVDGKYQYIIYPDHALPVYDQATMQPMVGGIQVTGGSSGHCALLSGGVVKCWGDARHAYIGDGPTGEFNDGLMNWSWGTHLNANYARTVNLPEPATEVLSGHYVRCAKGDSKAWYCWGSNAQGQLGRGPDIIGRWAWNGSTYAGSIGRGTPGVVSGLGGDTPATTAKKLAMGHAHGCAILENDTTKCWGTNMHGQLGNGTTNARAGCGYTDTPDNCRDKRALLENNLFPNPQAVPALNGMKLHDIAAGGGQGSASDPYVGGHTCVIRDSDRQVLCWGGNEQGQLGDGTTTSRSTPVLVQDLQGKAEFLFVNSRTSCALLATGDVKCWGSNDRGQLGIGKTAEELAYSTIPVQVRDLDGIFSDKIQIVTDIKHRSWVF